MKKQLGKTNNRKMFNTETGIVRGRSRGGSGERKYSETLYRTNRFDYFLHGKGGKLTRWEGKEDIVELTDKQATFWLKKHGAIL